MAGMPVKLQETKAEHPELLLTPSKGKAVAGAPPAPVNSGKTQDVLPKATVPFPRSTAPKAFTATPQKQAMQSAGLRSPFWAGASSPKSTPIRSPGMKKARMGTSPKTLFQEQAGFKCFHTRIIFRDSECPGLILSV